MKISNEKFFSARKDETHNQVIIHYTYPPTEDGQPKAILKLVIRDRERYTEKVNFISVDTDTDVGIDNNYWNDGQECRITSIRFEQPIYGSGYGDRCHYMTFLNAIKKGSDVKFWVSAFNQSRNLSKANFVAHHQYGIVDGKCYFLAAYAGKDDHPSPVIYMMVPTAKPQVNEVDH